MSVFACVHTQWRIQGGFLVARKPPRLCFFFKSGGDTVILAPTLTSHLHLRRSETPPETNSGYATDTCVRVHTSIYLP